MSLDFRDLIPRVAETFAGHSWGADGEPFGALLFPHDKPWDQRGQASAQSCCGTAREAILREAGVWGRLMWHGQLVDDALRMPYADRLRMRPALYAIAAEKGIAAGCDGWIDAMTWEGGALPLDGDGILVGGSNPKGAPRPILWSTGGEYGGEHEITALGWEDGELATVEGGASDVRNVDARGIPRSTAITRRRRRFVEVPELRELWTVEIPDTVADPAAWIAPLRDDGRPAKGRRVQGWSDAGRFRPVPS